MFSKVQRGVELPVARILRTPDGKIDVSANVRDASKYTPEFLERKAFDFRSVRKERPEVGFGSGIHKDIVVRAVPAPEWMKVAGKHGDIAYQIAQGHLRTLVAERDGVKSVPATVFYDLDNDHFTELVNDHGGETELELKEMYIAMEKLVALGKSPAQIFQQVRGTMEKLLGSNLSAKARAKLAEFKTDEEKADYLVNNTWKWHFQTAQRLNNVPFKFRDVMYKSIAKEQAWPTMDELKKASSLHDEDKKNPDGSRNEAVTRTNPGPKFNEFWNALMTEVERAKEAGEKPRKVSMMAAPEVSKLFDASEESLIARVILQRVLNKPGFTAEVYAQVIKWLAAVETGLGEEKMRELIRLLPAKPTEDVPNGK